MVVVGKRAARRLVSGMLVVLPLLIGSASATAGCSGGSKCAVRSENCSAKYLKDHGLDGCCQGLSCRDSPYTPGALTCQ